MMPAKTLVGLFAMTVGLLPLLPAFGDPNLPPQVIGYYSDGKLQNASSLPLDGVGFVHLFRERNRNYGSRDLIEILETVALEFRNWNPDSERLQIGDISAKTGGTISGHASHQNGLDVDLAYFRKNHHEQPLSFTTGFDESFVSSKGAISSNFDTARSWKFLSLLIATGRIERIFVDSAIKREFCHYYHSGATSTADDFNSDGTEMLRHLRPLDHHDDHWHVRITCPADSPKCIPQTPPVPPGDGCNSLDQLDLDWVD